MSLGGAWAARIGGDEPSHHGVEEVSFAGGQRLQWLADATERGRLAYSRLRRQKIDSCLSARRDRHSAGGAGQAQQISTGDHGITENHRVHRRTEGLGTRRPLLLPLVGGHQLALSDDVTLHRLHHLPFVESGARSSAASSA